MRRQGQGGQETCPLVPKMLAQAVKSLINDPKKGDEFFERLKKVTRNAKFWDPKAL